MDSLEEIIKKHSIVVKHEPIEEKVMADAQYMMIRHAYSDFNYRA